MTEPTEPTQPADDHGASHRRARGRHGWRLPDERPQWWPDDEAWPPARPEAWRALRRRFARRAAAFGCMVVVTLVVLTAVASWVLGQLFGGGWITVVLIVVLFLVLASVVRAVVRGMRLAFTPMSDLVEASARVEAGEVGTQVEVRGPSEVRTLARAFNSMSTRLAEDDAARRRLLADISHELRTPLTVIKGNVEGMLDGMYAPDREVLERILAETHQLERLIDDLRTLSLADAGMLALQREPTDLGALAAEALAAFEPQAAAASVTLVAQPTPAMPEIEIDPRRVRQAIANLVANAIRHTPPGGRVTVAVAPDGGGQQLSVTDTGSGMDAEAAAHAFDRFWRTADSPGAGLGLAIVRDLVAAHGGTVELETVEGAGTVVRCRFP